MKDEQIEALIVAAKSKEFAELDQMLPNFPVGCPDTKHNIPKEVVVINSVDVSQVP